MRCIIAGSRDLTDEHAVYGAIVRSGFMYQITEVVCGGATGGDDFGDKFAHFVGIPVQYFVVTQDGVLDRGVYNCLRNKRVGPERGAMYGRSLYENIVPAADWERDRLAAGPIRNGKMARYASPDGALVAVQRGGSKGTANMIATAREYGLRVYVEEVE